MRHAEPPTTHFQVVLTSYENAVLPFKAACTIYQMQLLFQRWRRTLGPKLLTEFTPDRLSQWRDCWLHHGLAPGTVTQRLWILQGLLRWAVEQGWLATNPMAQVAKPCPTVRPTCAVTPDALERLFVACRASHNTHLYPFVLLIVATGMRKRQLCALRWEELDLARGTLLLSDAHTPCSWLSLPEPLLTLLQAKEAVRCPTIPWVFPNKERQGPMVPYYGWRKACQQAGLPGLRFEDLRHAAC